MVIDLGLAIHQSKSKNKSSREEEEPRGRHRSTHCIVRTLYQTSDNVNCER